MKTISILVRTGLLFVLIILVSASSIIVEAQSKDAIYLPIVEKNARYGFGTDNKFLGIYMQTYWNYSSVPDTMSLADNLAGKKHSVTGWFIDITDAHPGSNLNGQLNALWANGYVSFVNLNSTATAYEIASGQLDYYINQMAGYYASWVAQGGGRRAFLAPLPEMNGVDSYGNPWTSYGGDPVNFKLAYQRILNIFAQNGVSRDQVWWVFAPNGWSKAGHEFEVYYPGDNLVDVVAFSMYNYGWCSVAHPWEKWENYDSLYEPYIARFQALSPDKPIIIAQTGTTAQYGSTGDNVWAKNTWLRVNYEYMSGQPQLLGTIYYDMDQSSWECNWKVTGGNTYQPGYHDGASFQAFQYMNWQVLQSIIP